MSRLLLILVGLALPLTFAVHLRDPTIQNLLEQIEERMNEATSTPQAQDEPINDPKQKTKLIAKDMIDELLKHNIVPPEPLIKLLNGKDLKVLVIYVGGTLGMEKTPEGYIPKPQFLEKFIRSHPSMCDLNATNNSPGEFIISPTTTYGNRINYHILEFEKLLDSSDMNIDDWVDIASTIQDHYRHYDSFVILQGTDTLPYTASMLSFILEGLKKTVVLTAAQIPITEMRNDAENNIISSLQVAGQFWIPEVIVVFNNKIFRGNRIIKKANNDIDAFNSPNFPFLGHLEIDIFIDFDLVKIPENNDQLQVWTNLNLNYNILRIHPSLTNDEFEEGLKGFDVVLIEGYGVGNIPNNEIWFSLMEEAIKQGIVLIDISKCVKGDVEASYASGTKLAKMGIINGADITEECAESKIAYLLGKGYASEDFKQAFISDLHGELTEA